ncbi:hypothetical protein MUU48_00780 [Scandinavium sp. H11S7]|uniref:hypothetical protein n=1 Tax=Scandinavium hiltneri TaxID=2926519 RepID=UPI0021653FE1|nr:hypothetical protein [Scandinavium hiltneri]MCS2155504.1 hypothetical protein [Scandinavium hiltneri]
MQQKAEAVDDRDTAVMAYAVQTACTELSELRSEHAAAMNTITAIIDILGKSDELSISGQVSALLAQRDVLAAESAGLKSAITAASPWLPRSNSSLTVEQNLLALVDAALRTPATDAFLAEVRAQGVEMFAKHCQKRHGEMMKSEPNEAASNQAITATRRAGEFALYFAAQLRKGVQS